MVARKATAEAPRRSEVRPSQALDTFEKAMKALGKHDYEKARDYFDAVIEAAPEAELVERARSYRTLCARSLEKKPAPRMKSFEDVLNHGVFLLNRGDHEEAARVLRQAVDMQPKNPDALYCLAAAAARGGDAPGAVKALRAAIASSPATRAQAKSDSDFDGVRQDAEFAALLAGH